MSWQNPCRLDVEGPGLHCRCWWIGDPCCGCHEQMQPPGPRRMHGPACNPRPPLRALLRHLIEAHCPEGWEPECFIVGPRAYAVGSAPLRCRGAGLSAHLLPSSGLRSRTRLAHHPRGADAGGIGCGMTLAVRLLEGIVNLIERYVPEQRREVEIANLLAVAKEIAGPELTMGR